MDILRLEYKYKIPEYASYFSPRRVSNQYFIEDLLKNIYQSVQIKEVTVFEQIFKRASTTENENCNLIILRQEDNESWTSIFLNKRMDNISDIKIGQGLKKNPEELLKRLGFQLKSSVNYKEIQYIMPLLRTTVHLKDKNDELIFYFDGSLSEQKQLQELADYFKNELESYSNQNLSVSQEQHSLQQMKIL